jgi:hypothetical protein
MSDHPQSDHPQSDHPQSGHPRPEHRERASAADSADTSLDRLRATDPASAAEPDLAAVRREVDRRIAGADATPAVPRRAPGRWWRVGAVAAGVALVGSASFVVGQQTAGGPDRTATAAVGDAGGPQIAVGGPAVAGPRAGGTAPGAAPEAAGPGVAAGALSAPAAQDRSLIAGWGGRTHFNDGGLPTEGGAADAWGYDPAQVLSAATAERVAAAMGLSGSATVQYQGWVVGAQDGSGPSVSLMGDGVASVSYSDPAAYPSCDASVSAAAETAGEVQSDAGGAKPDVGCTPTVPADLGATEAIARSTEVMSRIGVDPAGFDLTSPDDGAGSGYRTVLATASVAGQATAGPQWTFSFVGDRLASFYGALAPLVGLGQYPVVSPAEAVARMNDPRFGAMPGAYPADVQPAVGTAEPGIPADPDSGTVTAPAAPTPGAPVAWPVTEITLTGAALGLIGHYQADGSTLLLPSWTMTDDAGSTWTVVAVSDDRLDFTS